MRKSRRCDATKLELLNTFWRMRVCLLTRGHEANHLDEHGRWKK